MNRNEKCWGSPSYVHSRDPIDKTPRQVDELSMRASGRCLVPLLSFSVSSVYLIRVEVTFDVQVHILSTYDLVVGTEPRRKPGNVWIAITRRTVSHPLRKWDVVSCVFYPHHIYTFHIIFRIKLFFAWTALTVFCLLWCRECICLYQLHEFYSPKE